MLRLNTDNVNFQANISTKLKGRGNVMSKFSKAFEQKTANMPGTLNIRRGGTLYPDSITFSINNEADTCLTYYDYNKLLAKSDEDVTQKFVNQTADKFVKIFKILQQEVRHDETIKSIEKQIARIKDTISTNTNRARHLRSNGGSVKFINSFESVASSAKQKVEILQKEKERIHSEFIDKIYSIAGKDKDLQIYADALSIL